MASHPLKATLSEAMKDAMRARDKERLGAIRLILSEVKRIEVDERCEIDDDRLLLVLDKMCKQRRDSISQFQNAGRDELAAREQFELDVIQSFMPAQLDEAELTGLVNEAISQSGATAMQDMGKVMAILKPQLQGRADMAAVSRLVKAQLN